MKYFCLALFISLMTTQVVAQTRVQIEGRPAIIYTPPQLPAIGKRAAILVFHGGMGNADHILSGDGGEAGLNLNSIANSHRVLIAYLNGTRVARLMREDRLGWNAGNCCGLPARQGVDDVAYVSSVVDYLVRQYGVDKKQVYGIGHSNGAMMVQRIVCQTDLFAAAVAVSGPLMTANETCPGAKGKRILAIHGADDKNVPVNGGRGEKGISFADFTSEEHSRQVLTHAGAQYELQIIPGADHQYDHVDEGLRKIEKKSIGEKTMSFFGL